MAQPFHSLCSNELKTADDCMETFLISKKLFVISSFRWEMQLVVEPPFVCFELR